MKITGNLADEAAKVGLWLRTLLALFYNYGWHKLEAAKHLKVSQIDLASRTLLLSEVLRTITTAAGFTRFARA